MKTTPKPKLTRAAFKAWLQSKRPNAIVGVSTDATKCPITKFCGPGSETGYQYLKTGGKLYALPNWAHDFIDGIESLPDSIVTAKEALEVLEAMR